MRIHSRHYWFFALLLILTAACRKPFYSHQESSRFYTILKTDTPDSSMVKMLEPYKKGVDTQMLVVVGHTDIPMTKAQPESTLGNLVADAQLRAARKLDKKVAGSIANYGGIRIPYIAPGPITKGTIYELMPFDNMLTIVEIPGDILRQFCHHMAKFEGWPVSGISYQIKDKQAKDIKVNGEPLNEHLVYKIATNDYIARGGDNCSFLSVTRKRFTRIFIRDAIIDYILEHEKQDKPVHPNLENRVQHAE